MFHKFQHNFLTVSAKFLREFSTFSLSILYEYLHCFIQKNYIIKARKSCIFFCLRMEKQAQWMLRRSREKVRYDSHKVREFHSEAGRRGKWIVFKGKWLKFRNLFSYFILFWVIFPSLYILIFKAKTQY